MYMHMYTYMVCIYAYVYIYGVNIYIYKVLCLLHIKNYSIDPINQLCLTSGWLGNYKT